MGSCQSFLCVKNKNKSRERLLRLDDQIDISKRTKDKKAKSLNDGAYFYDMFDPQFSTSKGPPIIPEVGPGK